ncbi:SDR family NAD(P)-dependent oxidoreductase [Streptomyces sp. Z26]|uniref:SDR family oxidoreductase n=1 Tax=Streptomyces sp. Z26 TaxID=2500177 RepID=UPI000EF17376|nr:SDR family NAD(P)-dependent oxidoreductase [Streptomyces sp. Z26]RLL67662.1 SDR family NAD(P)-dependent oxidoreductase [Streptomyces sp. Z26]
MTAPHVTLITGGSGGIGAATARQLLRQGRKVAVTGRDGDRLKAFAQSVAGELGSEHDLLTLVGHAADEDAVESAVATTVEWFGRLDAVVANAGFADPDNLGGDDTSGWREMVLTNVLGPALLIRAALPALKRTGGRIVLVGSVAGLVHTPGNLYGATKWAVTGIAENTRLMVTGDGVGVTLVAPGRTDTGFWDVVGQAPEGRLLTADQVADSLTWAVNQPSGVDVNTVVIRPLGQPV